MNEIQPKIECQLFRKLSMKLGFGRKVKAGERRGEKIRKQRGGEREEGKKRDRRKLHIHTVRSSRPGKRK